MPNPLQALLYVLAGYLALQIGLNLLVRLLAQRSPNRAMTALKGSFWANIANAIFFCVAAALLHIWQVAPNRPPGPQTGWWALGGIPLGIALWYASAKARGLGIRLFGTGNIVAAEDAVLRFPPGPAYLTWGVLNQSLIQPLGRELFTRAVFLPLAVNSLGLARGIALTLLIDLAPRLNVVWLPLVLLYSLTMGLLFYLSGGALCGLIAAAVSGFLHSVALAYASANLRERDHQQVMQQALARPDQGNGTGGKHAGSPRER